MKILLLAGTTEARHLAQALLEAGHHVISSLAGATRAPRNLSGQVRIGGFGGADGFLRYIADERPDLVIDATHPFAAQITDRTARLCAQESLPYLHLLRPPWEPDGSGNWFEIDTAEAARQYIPSGARVFLATGRQTLPAFANLSDCYLICRQIDSPDGPFPFPNGDFLVSRPPFTVEDERRLFEELDVGWLVIKNAGGAASRAKIEAMLERGGTVLMIRRPPPPEAPRVATLQEALEWVADFERSYRN